MRRGVNVFHVDVDKTGGPELRASGSSRLIIPFCGLYHPASKNPGSSYSQAEELLQATISRPKDARLGTVTSAGPVRQVSGHLRSRTRKTTNFHLPCLQAAKLISVILAPARSSHQLSQSNIVYVRLVLDAGFSRQCRAGRLTLRLMAKHMLNLVRYALVVQMCVRQEHLRD